MAAPTSAAAAVAELEAALEPMQNYKAPGVTANRIANITTICVDNIQVRYDIERSIASRLPSQVPRLTSKLSL